MDYTTTMARIANMIEIKFQFNMHVNNPFPNLFVNDPVANLRSYSN
jgi:hypothetical protein